MTTARSDRRAATMAINQGPARAAAPAFVGVFFFAAALLLLGGTGCQRGTYLEVRFLGAGLTGVSAIRVRLTLMPPGGGAELRATDTVRPGGNGTITFPTSMAFVLNDEEGRLRVDAEALSGAGVAIASGSVDTAIQHNKTWQVVVDFAGGSGADAGGDGGGGGLTVNDGSIADGLAGCASITFRATDSVSLDYDSAGPGLDAGNFLWARASPQQNVIGWLKFDFDVADLPAAVRQNVEVTSAELRLTLAQASGSPARLVVQYASFDGWTRQSAPADQLVATHPLSQVFEAPQAGANLYPLLLPMNSHDWRADLVDGTLTIGIDNVTAGTAASNVEFYGVDRAVLQPLVRPALDVTLCRR